jgi:hypothetical protein
MGKHFTEESYNVKKEANKILKDSGVSTRQRMKILGISSASIYYLQKYNWNEYRAYLADKKAKRETREEKKKLTQEEERQADMDEVAREEAQEASEAPQEQIDRIEAKIDLLGRMIAKNNRMIAKNNKKRSIF